jgi:two-component system NtrC family sensor kinase
MAWWWPFPNLRLRSKLVLSLSLAALVPVAVVAVVAVSVILDNIDRGLRDDAQRQLDVGLNLVLRTAERLGDEVVQLASTTGVAPAIGQGKEAVAELVGRTAPYLPSGLLQITDASGATMHRQVIGGSPDRYVGLDVPASSPIVVAGRSWVQRVTLERVGDRLVVRAVAPVVDSSLALQGVAVMSVPLDGAFADGIKGALGTDVIVAAPAAGPRGPTWSSFRDGLGRRRADLELGALPDAGPASREPAAPARRRFIRIVDVDRSGHDFVVALTGLVDHQGQVVGYLGVAVDRRSLAATRVVAIRSLIMGGLVALAFALAIAAVLTRRLGRPISRLHRGAVAVARGDLDTKIDVPPGDEIADLAEAFTHMTQALKDNQQRLAARMREIVALHDAGRAVSSVIDLAHVMNKTVDAVARTFDARLCALWLVEPDVERTLVLGAARARRVDVSASLATEQGMAAARELEPLAAEVVRGGPVRLIAVGDDPRRAKWARAAGIDGSLIGVPLERKRAPVGVLIVGRLAAQSRSFSEADANLLSTFADQAASAIENARLYEQVRGASEELERKVRLRTAELTAINAELGRALADLRDTQAQLILSERMAGLGLLVAGVAHEINSPSAAIRGSVDALGEVVHRTAVHLSVLAAGDLPVGPARATIAEIEALGPTLAARRMPTGPNVRRVGRELRAHLEARGVIATGEIGVHLAELGADLAEVDRLTDAAEGDVRVLAAAVDYLSDHVFLHRTTLTIRNAVKRIQRIVGALKSYSHLDQQAVLAPADLHDGIETTLTLLDYALRDITVHRHYGDLPAVPIFADELNQVWTNLIQNAVQALGGNGNITIETAVDGERAVVRVIDDGPGISDEALPRIFDPFFTTKTKGEGTGLGLGIVRRIIDKHAGEVRCESLAGRTCFEVRLPLSGPQAMRAGSEVEPTEPASGVAS